MGGAADLAPGIAEGSPCGRPHRHDRSAATAGAWLPPRNATRTAMKSGLVRATLTLLTGSVAAHAIPLVLGPALTRLYSPEDFGQFALLWALATNLAVVGCARYEFALPLESTELRAAQLMALCARILLAVTTASAAGGQADATRRWRHPAIAVRIHEDRPAGSGAGRHIGQPGRGMDAGQACPCGWLGGSVAPAVGHTPVHGPTAPGLSVAQHTPRFHGGAAGHPGSGAGGGLDWRRRSGVLGTGAALPQGPCDPHRRGLVANPVPPPSEGAEPQRSAHPGAPGHDGAGRPGLPAGGSAACLGSGHLFPGLWRPMGADRGTGPVHCAVHRRAFHGIAPRGGHHGLGRAGLGAAPGVGWTMPVFCGPAAGPPSGRADLCRMGRVSEHAGLLCLLFLGVGKLEGHPP